MTSAIASMKKTFAPVVLVALAACVDGYDPLYDLDPSRADSSLFTDLECPPDVCSFDNTTFGTSLHEISLEVSLEETPAALFRVPVPSIRGHFANILVGASEGGEVSLSRGSEWEPQGSQLITRVEAGQEAWIAVTGPPEAGAIVVVAWAADHPLKDVVPDRDKAIELWCLPHVGSSTCTAQKKGRLGESGMRIFFTKVGGVATATIGEGATAWYRSEGEWKPLEGDPRYLGLHTFIAITGPPGASYDVSVRYRSVCFVAGTKIETPLGPRNIEDIKLRDEVFSFDERSGDVVTSSVSRLWVTADVPTLRLFLEDGSEIRTTAEHPFYRQTSRRSIVSRMGAAFLPAELTTVVEAALGARPTGEFVAAVRLEVGDTLFHLNEGSDHAGRSLESVTAPLRIARIEEGAAENVYNFTVARTHTYFAERVLVHNK